MRDECNLLIDSDAGTVHVQSGPVSACYTHYGLDGTPELLVNSGDSFATFDGRDLDSLCSVLNALSRVVRFSPTREYIEERKLGVGP